MGKGERVGFGCTAILYVFWREEGWGDVYMNSHLHVYICYLAHGNISTRTTVEP